MGPCTATFDSFTEQSPKMNFLELLSLFKLLLNNDAALIFDYSYTLSDE